MGAELFGCWMLRSDRHRRRVGDKGAAARFFEGLVRTGVTATRVLLARRGQATDAPKEFLGSIALSTPRLYCSGQVSLLSSSLSVERPASTSPDSVHSSSSSDSGFATLSITRRAISNMPAISMLSA